MPNSARQYTRNPPLDESSLAATPQAQFERWLADAVAAEMIEPTAMALATVDPSNRPSVRIVLFKGFEDGAFSFYTHYDSRKARALAGNPAAAATFWWDRLERSVRVEGRVEKLPREVSERYFHSRPRGSQLGAATSRQSRNVASRKLLEDRLAQAEARLAGRPVPLPEDWGGYRLIPEAIEFWQGRRDRLHDRLLYLREGASGWRVERLEP
jgi:pyridoxamine 5'-phosphate oxidase